MTCLKSKIKFNTEAFEKIIFEPEWVIENEKEFWETFPAQKYTRDWAKYVNKEILYEEWRNRIKEWAEIPLRERENHIYMKNARKILQGKEVFLTKALPHLCSYLPYDAQLDITIHFTSFIPARAFAMGEIVINMAADYWNNNPDNILNVIVHEVFHVGYIYCEDRAEWVNNREDQRIKVMRNIHNEGICTYVAYNAREIFPAPDEKDFQYLDDPEVIKRHIDNVEMIFSKIGKISEDELEKLIWDVGVIGRSFYVVGAYMCGAIEKRMGKNALIKTMFDGPRSFFELYNESCARSAQARNIYKNMTL